MHYTSQLTEKIRIDIGKMLLAHEIVKLFPKSDYENLKSQIDEKWKDFNNVENIRDFWNLIDSLMMGYKLKDIVRLLITSSQIGWDLTTLSVEELRFTSDISHIEGFSIGGKTADEVINYLKEHTEKLQLIKKGTEKEYKNASFRANDPIIVEKQPNGSLHTHDGNGRLIKAIIEGQSQIPVYIGMYNQNPKTNSWIPTSYLQKLAEEKCENLLIKLLRQSDNAIYEFKNRIVIDEQFKIKILNSI